MKYEAVICDFCHLPAGNEYTSWSIETHSGLGSKKRLHKDACQNCVSKLEKTFDVLHIPYTSFYKLKVLQLIYSGEIFSDCLSKKEANQCQTTKPQPISNT